MTDPWDEAENMRQARQNLRVAQANLRWTVVFLSLAATLEIVALVVWATQ